MNENNAEITQIAKKIERNAKLYQVIGGFGMLAIIAAVVINTFSPDSVNPYVAIPIINLQWTFIMGIILMVIALLKYPREEYDPKGGLKQIDNKIQKLKQKMRAIDRRAVFDIEEKRDKTHKKTYEAKIGELEKRKAAIVIITRTQEDKIEGGMKRNE